MTARDELIRDLKLWACSPRVPEKAQLLILEAIGALSSYVPREATPAMIGAAREIRVNLQFGNQGISGPISPFEAREIWERMYEAAIRECENCEAPK
jgi:hypothetical protein